MPRTENGEPAPQALAPGGQNPLFWAVLAAILLGVLAGLLVEAREPPVSLRSALVFRVQVAVIVALAIYLAAAALWLAWHQTLFQRVGLGAAAAEPPASELQERDIRVEQFMEETTEALQNHTERLEALEERRESTRDEPGRTT